MTESSGAGSVYRKIIGSKTNNAMTGTRFMRAKMVWVKGKLCPAIFSTKLSAEPGGACDSTTEPDNPPVEMTKPGKGAATTQPKSTGTRFAISPTPQHHTDHPNPAV